MATARARPRSLGVPDRELVRARAEELRLDVELRALTALGLGLRDWRKLSTTEIAVRSREARKAPSAQHPLLATAVFTGTAQACFRGSYWAPAFGLQCAEEVSCRHLHPVSRLHVAGRMPPAGSLERAERFSPARLTCHARCHPLDVCVRLADAVTEGHRVATVRFSAVGDPRSESTVYQHPFEDQLFLRTTYFQASERVSADIGEPVGPAIDAGGLVYTPSVGVLRGPLEEGAPWSEAPARVDVLWVGLQARPHLEEQQQYAREDEREAMANVLDRIFAWAAAQGVDALVLPPLGCGTHGCHHPPLDVAELLFEAIGRHGRRFAEIAVASDVPAHNEGGWWEAFAEAVQCGRPPIHRQALAPAPAYHRRLKTEAELQEKQRRLQQRQRPQRETFL